MSVWEHVTLADYHRRHFKDLLISSWGEFTI